MSAPLVFVVDDEKIIATTLAMILNKSGFNAHPFFDPREALQAATAPRTLLSETLAPDILLVDIIMPGMSGIDLALSILSHHPKCRVILFSGIRTASNLLDQAAHQGHRFEVLAKPVDPKDLIELLRVQQA